MTRHISEIFNRPAHLLVLRRMRDRQCLHQHVCFELILALDGPIELTCDGVTTRSTSFLVPPMRLHETSRYVGRLVILYRRTGVQRVAFWKDAPILSGLADAGALAGRAAALFETMDPADADDLAARWVPSWIDPANEAPPCDPRVAAVLAHVEDPDAVVTATRASTARQVDLSPTRFAALFAENMGMPLGRYLIWRRVEIGLDALRRRQTVTSAAAQAGFSDGPHFVRCARATMGNVPSGMLARIATPTHDALQAQAQSQVKPQAQVKAQPQVKAGRRPRRPRADDPARVAAHDLSPPLALGSIWRM